MVSENIVSKTTTFINTRKLSKTLFQPLIMLWCEPTMPCQLLWEWFCKTAYCDTIPLHLWPCNLLVLNQFLASLENRPIVLLERFQGNSNRIELQRVKSKHDIFPVKIKLSNKIIIRPNHIHLQKSEAETLTKEAFLDRLGLNAKPKIPVLSISKSVNPLTGAKVFALANKSLPVIGFSKQNRLVIERAPVRSSSILLSPSKPRTMKGQNSLDLSITSNDSESVEDPSDDLLNIDLSSPMGLKLKSLVSSQCQKCSTIRYYDHYCNKIQTQADRRSLRSQTTYCKYKNKILMITIIPSDVGMAAWRF